ncbi:MAG TPA: exodeoxyribonuclease III [Polyangiaceae bacterium]|nr:exodeoxyribonuclease III [Polyangiaceae bacterium]
MKLATWNVNSIRARHAALFAWLARVEPDVLCMQETKVVDDDFPTDEFLRMGYAVAMAGQKTYNGVAIASRLPMSDVRVGLHDETDPKDKRLIRAKIDGVVVYSAYVPNGKSVESPSFREKLGFFARLRETLERETSPDAPAVVCGDFNVAPDDRDVYDPDALRGQLHFSDAEHAALADLKRFGLVDLFREKHDEGGLYSWWDYRGGGFHRNLGLRIDLLLATRPLAARCSSADIDVEPRHADKPSDHTPVVATFA